MQVITSYKIIPTMIRVKQKTPTLIAKWDNEPQEYLSIAGNGSYLVITWQDDNPKISRFFFPL